MVTTTGIDVATQTGARTNGVGQRRHDIDVNPELRSLSERFESLVWQTMMHPYFLQTMSKKTAFTTEQTTVWRHSRRYQAPRVIILHPPYIEASCSNTPTKQGIGDKGKGVVVGEFVLNKSTIPQIKPGGACVGTYVTVRMAWRVSRTPQYDSKL